MLTSLFLWFLSLLLPQQPYVSAQRLTTEELPTAQPSSDTLNQASCESDPAFAWIPAGDFILGSDRQERDYGYRLSAVTAAPNDPQRRAQIEANLRSTGWFEGERPQQLLTLPGVCLSRNLVTNQDYQSFLEATGHRIPFISAADYQSQGFLVHPYSTVQRFLWSESTFPGGEENHPVVLVSYEDVQQYAQWRGEQDGLSYRLPTEVEWEQAARGSDSRYFPWGSEWQSQATNVAQGGPHHTSVIASYPLSRSIYGIEDMAGNVFEYTSTLVTRNGTLQSVMKGCSWDDSPGFCRAAYRHTRPTTSRHILFGFRLVRE